MFAAAAVADAAAPDTEATGASAAAGGADGSALGAAGSPELAVPATDETSGTDGPNRTPARRGQATPTTKPIAAMTATFVQGGLSPDAEGTSTVGEPPALRRSMGDDYHGGSKAGE